MIPLTTETHKSPAACSALSTVYYYYYYYSMFVLYFSMSST